MESKGVEIVQVAGLGDERGSSYPVSVKWLSKSFPLRDVHITTLFPGHIRGNHFHVTRHEILLVMHSDRWSLHWDCGEGTTIEHRQFEGQGTTVICVSPHASHAILIDGNALLHIVGLADYHYSPAAPDAFLRPVTPP
jgi:hypothetical protein